jgi:hypothetical protein
MNIALASHYIPVDPGKFAAIIRKYGNHKSVCIPLCISSFYPSVSDYVPPYPHEISWFPWEPSNYCIICSYPRFPELSPMHIVIPYISIIFHNYIPGIDPIVIPIRNSLFGNPDSPGRGLDQGPKPPDLLWSACAARVGATGPGRDAMGWDGSIEGYPLLNIPKKPCKDPPFSSWVNQRTKWAMFNSYVKYS